MILPKYNPTNAAINPNIRVAIILIDAFRYSPSDANCIVLTVIVEKVVNDAKNPIAKNKLYSEENVCLFKE